MTTSHLSKLFDYQRFEKNERLQKLISKTHAGMEEKELTDDELDMIAAAGAAETRKQKKPGDLLL